MVLSVSVLWIGCGEIKHSIGRRQLAASNPPKDAAAAAAADSGKANDSGKTTNDASETADDPSYPDEAGADNLEGGTSTNPSAPDASRPEVACTDLIGEPGLDIYLMMDAMLRSDNGGLPSPPGMPLGTVLWQSAQSDVSDFLSYPENQSIGVGIEYYGYGTPSDCSSDKYQKPRVAIDTVSSSNSSTGKTHIATIRDSFLTIAPGIAHDDTPALRGAIGYARSIRASKVNTSPFTQQVVFFFPIALPDPPPGIPSTSTCSSAIQTAVAASDGYKNDPSIETYVIGVWPMGTSGSTAEPFKPIVDEFNSVADSGGTAQAYMASLVTGDVNLAEKMREARLAAACEFALPLKNSGTVIFPALFNVSWSQSGEPLKRYSDKNGCTDSSGILDGWYFDAPENPKRIITCPKTCEQIQQNLLTPPENKSGILISATCL